jgi:hypothetical protein
MDRSFNIYVATKKYAYSDLKHPAAQRFKKEGLCLHTVKAKDVNEAKKIAKNMHSSYYPENPYATHGVCPYGSIVT